MPVGIDRDPQRGERIAGFGAREQIDVAVQCDRYAGVDQRIFVAGQAARGAVHDRDAGGRRSARDQRGDALRDERDLGGAIGGAMHAHRAAGVDARGDAAGRDRVRGGRDGRRRRGAGGQRRSWWRRV